MALELLAAAVACYALAGLFGLGVLKWRWSADVSAATAIVAGLLVVVTAALWLGGAKASLTLPVSTPIGGLAFRATPLAGTFLLLSGVVGTGISLYTAGYAPHVGGPLRQASLHSLLNLSFASILLVLAAANAFSFLLAWEVMVIATYLLVTLEFDRPGRPQAAFLMLALAKIGFIAMAVGFIAVGALRAGVSFESLAHHPVASGALASAAFVLFLVGFGVKAGLVPLQGWLPEAHPAAPANVSAALSGIVVSMGIYGLVLTVVTLLPTPAAWWGYLALGIGLITAAYGVLFSLLVPNLKRMLAYSTVENLGFMVAMLGVALVFASSHHRLLAAASLVVVILHALYHALLKSTLFMGAGCVDVGARGLDLDRLGGLARRMRWTTLLFFIGAMGLAGIPPLNGFQTEWLGLQMLIRSRVLDSPESRVYMAAAGMLLTLTFALAATAYVRVFGGAFLGAPRSRGAAQSVEVPITMRLGMLVTAGVAVVTALLPPIGIGEAVASAEGATHAPGLLNALLPPFFLHPAQFALPIQVGGTFLSQILHANGMVIVPTSFNYAFISPTYIFLSLVCIVALTAGALRLVGRQARRESDVWVGAGSEYKPSMQYTSTAFTNLFRSTFGGVFRDQRAVERDYHQAPFFAHSVRYGRRVVEPVEAYVYRPVVAAARRVSGVAGGIQSGHVSLYLLYLVTMFVIVLLIH
ncbi:MAG TPA: proton-conducting transporter membrane subunit [Candidatus Dormibacteraeota bacterium]|nr:proton-conducting transporter membrane subunit [Candidatus Dormibacteraeota bacterium]